jgi:hypothetical protein
MCDWILESVGAEVPVHFSAFHPDFRMTDRPRTPHETLVMARDIAVRQGLKFVYVGNVNGATLVSSSDKIFTYYQDPNQVGESLAKRFQEQGVQSKDSAISGHVDFVKLVSLIDSLKGTASLFAPQANTQDMGIKTDFMKQLGFLSFEIIEQRDRLSGKVIFSE